MSDNAAAAAAAIMKYTRVQSLRDELAEAVRTEAFPRAAEIRDELKVLAAHVDVAVLDANNAFYTALRAHDLDAMESVWPAAKTDDRDCSTRTYDGFAPLHGREEILQVWREVYSDRQMVTFDTHLELSSGENTAVVTCVERRLGAICSSCTSVVPKRQRCVADAQVCVCA